MPLVQLSIIDGRTDQQKEMLINEVTEAIHRSIDAPRETIRVLLNEIPAQHWGIGGKSAKALGR